MYHVVEICTFGLIVIIKYYTILITLSLWFSALNKYKYIWYFGFLYTHDIILWHFPLVFLLLFEFCLTLYFCILVLLVFIIYFVTFFSYILFLPVFIHFFYLFSYTISLLNFTCIVFISVSTRLGVNYIQK
jgi:hypothetical protein